MQIYANFMQINFMFRPSSQISRHSTSAATWTTSTLSGRAFDCVLGRSLRALNKFYN